MTAEVPAGTAIIFPGTMPHRSVNSKARDIRWSTDYRLHRATAKRSGFKPSSFKHNLDWFYGLKDSLLLRPGTPAWKDWAADERTAAQDSGMGVSGSHSAASATEAAASALGDAVVVGPWMDLWNITTHVDGGSNLHVDRYMATPPAQRDIQRYMDIGNW